MAFKANGIRTNKFKFSKHDINTLKKNWKKQASKTKSYPKGYVGRGIVFTAGGISYTTCLWISISLLRSKGCKLPIEIWHVGNELSNEVKETFNSLNVEFRDFYEKGDINLSGYMLKPMAIINSRFEEVLFIDADNNCIKDPEYLFSIDRYKDTGCMFWPDFWQTSKDNSIWKIIGIKYLDTPEQESGQIIINKRLCWKELQLCLHFNQLSDYYYRILFGDKDTFRFAWLALGSQYYMIDHPVGTCGFKENGLFYGTTMVQHDPAGKIIFLHRNLLKWDITRNREYCWEFIKTFKKPCAKKEITIKKSPMGSIAIDISGDILEIEFNTLFNELEAVCLSFLSEWRSFEAFRNFWEYLHFAKNRYPSKVNFSLEN